MDWTPTQVDHPCGSVADDKRTCLHLAASVGNMRVINALLEHSVDINFKDRWGGTALADAVREGHRDIASLLSEAGATLDYDEETAAGTLCECADRDRPPRDLHSTRLMERTSLHTGCRGRVIWRR